MGTHDPDRVDRALDPLRNVSVFRATCHACGVEVREQVLEDVPDGWIVCECGHVLHAENRVRWN